MAGPIIGGDRGAPVVAAAADGVPPEDAASEWSKTVKMLDDVVDQTQRVRRDEERP